MCVLVRVGALLSQLLSITYGNALHSFNRKSSDVHDTLPLLIVGQQVLTNTLVAPHTIQYPNSLTL